MTMEKIGKKFIKNILNTVNGVSMNNETNESPIIVENNSGVIKKKNPNSFYKNKKNNNFLRGKNRQDKNTNNNISNENPTLAEQSNISKTNNLLKEDFTSPEYLLFSHLRQKTGNHPNKFWENLHLVLKNKDFPDIRRADMSLISYAALYESVEIFETLLYDYGNLIPQNEIESSIFKLSTNKNPLILHHTITFYNNLYEPHEAFIDDFLKLAGKASYREEANQLLINWLTPKMTDLNKQNFWTICLEHKNISFINLALQNFELNTFLKNNESIFENLIRQSGRENTIYKSLNKAIDPLLAPELTLAVKSAKNNQAFVISQQPEENFIIEAPHKGNPIIKNKTVTSMPEISIKKKRKIV